MTSCKVAFLKSKIPEGCVNPICIIDAPGFATLIAVCLVNSRPTVSNIISKEFSFIFHAYEPDDLRAPDSIKKWSPDPKNIEKGRILKAIEWERRRIFKEELKRSREELAASCELNGAHW